MPRKPASNKSQCCSETTTTINFNERVLTFVANDLGRDIDLMCAFQKINDKSLPKDQQQVCWKVIKLGPVGQQSAGVTYTANTAFFIPQTNAGTIVYPLLSCRCATTQRIRLEADETHMYFTPPEKGGDGLIEVRNNTTFATDIGIGFVDDNGENLSTGLLFKRVGVGAAVRTQFTPVLKVYATSHYQENELLRGQIVYPLVWSQNLMELDRVTRLRVKIDPTTNVPQIVKTVVPDV